MKPHDDLPKFFTAENCEITNEFEPDKHPGLPKPPRMREWQLIKDVPVPDDRYVLLFSPETPAWDGNMFVAKRFDSDCYWTCGGPNGGIDLEIEHFTHWMELPEEPPK